MMMSWWSVSFSSNGALSCANYRANLFSDELEGVGEDIQIDEANIKMKHRAKYLLFHENRRPAYHGTWRKKSSVVFARKPLGQYKVRILSAVIMCRILNFHILEVLRLRGRL
jgi:hypothetical protein